MLILLAGALYLSTYYMKEQQRLANVGDVPDALETVRLAARLNPFDSAPLVAASSLLQQQGQNEAAARALEHAIERDPANYTNRVHLGDLQLNRLNDPEAAVESYRRALEQAPRDTGLIFSLAQAHVMVGDLEGAKQEYEKLVEFRKITARGLYDLGKIYVRTGDPEKGVQALGAAKEKASARLKGSEGLHRVRREAFVRSVDLAIADAHVVQGNYEEARKVLEGSDSEQAPALLELLNTDPEGYRERVLDSEV